MYNSGIGKIRSAIIISHNTTHSLLIAQLSDEDSFDGNKCHIRFYAASIYLDYNEPIENNIKNLENILKFTKGAKLIVGMDSNSRSKTCHDILIPGAKSWRSFQQVTKCI